MKKEIDINLIIQEGKRKKVSPYILIKRKLHYRKSNSIRKCDNCRMVNKPIFDGVERIQCHWIGESNSRYADIQNNNVCNWYEKGYQGEECENI